MEQLKSRVFLPRIVGQYDTGETRAGAGAQASVESAQEVLRDVQRVARIQAIPALLQILRESTGMGFAGVARVSAESWTACAVQDTIDLGLIPGAQLDVNTTLCIESMAARAPIVIGRASTDPRYRDHQTPKKYKFESYVSVPIILGDGRYFGNLCAIDPRPADLSDPRTLSMFEQFARVIALQLDSDMNHEREHAALLDERAVSQLREEFIAVLGHDLRNPLQAFFAGCELLARRHADEWSLAMIARMKANAQRMSLLIDDVLDFARGRLGGNIGVNLQSAENLDSGLDAVVKELQIARPERTIVNNISVRRTVHCDVSRIQQLASNLLSNALTHGAATSPVKFTASADGDQLLIQVWNEGEPIPPESLGKIFSPFWRRATAANRDGLGLGLHICSQIVGAHHGSLTVTSSKEAGTQFSVRIPLSH